MKPEEIKKLRLDHKLSVAQAAYHVHVTDRTWRRYEDGTRAVPEAIVHLFCVINKIDYPLKP